ncbi:hypothetical protein B0T18DRAFT_391022 [Schizothecium vesticola]|uniref:Uncharacterized protein n=1 Tax=Schizothecium vesticola TaxID=314040 RepID=A0AA40EWJ0_9PEZI|nr:hypothetical protein B0T18DRAFT_391022 [Schizothecium vesticola]
MGTIDQRVTHIQAQRTHLRCCPVRRQADKTKGLDTMRLASLFGLRQAYKRGRDEEYEVPDDEHTGVEVKTGGDGHKAGAREVDDDETCDENDEYQEGMVVVGEDDN